MFQGSQSINDSRYYPMLFIGADGGDTVSLTLQIWAKYRTLPQDRKDILMSDELPEKIKSLQGKFRLSDDAIGQVTLFIRDVFFGELQMAECEAKIGAFLTTTNGGDPNQAKAIVEFIQKEILTIQPKPRVEEVSEEVSASVKTVSMPLLQAMSQYEQLSNQLITNERIRIKSQSDPVRPSLVYWIKYYRDELGVGVHDSVVRGNFLFRSENGKRLSVEERERVNLILKSVEENYPLQIDTEKAEIVFPNFATPKKEPFAISSGTKIIKDPEFGAAKGDEASARQFTASDQAGKKATLNPYQNGNLVISQNSQLEDALPGAEKGGMRFSSSHVFPAEKEKSIEQHEVAAEQAAKILTHQTPASPKASQSPTQAPTPIASTPPNPFYIRPVSSRSEKTTFKD